MSLQHNNGWDEFATCFAAVARVDPAELSASTRLIDDLNLDSLALFELIVGLVVAAGMASLEEDLDRRDWRRTSVGDLFEEWRSPPARGPRVQYTFAEDGRAR
jgi:acyl carrier protein